MLIQSVCTKVVTLLARSLIRSCQYENKSDSYVIDNLKNSSFKLESNTFWHSD